MTDETTARDRAIELVEDWIAKERVSGVPDMIDALLANPEVLRALAGAPTADVAEIERLRRIERAARSAMFDRPSAPGRDELRTLLAAAPEGVDAADEQDDQCPHCGRYCICGRLVEDDDGMDVEAQGEMADELTAAQAAIREARRWHTRDARMGHDDVRCLSCQEELWPCRTVRALDGDTTEERR